MDFALKSEFYPTGDQPEAIKKLVNAINNGASAQTLLGVTGSGKTFTIANVINELNRPVLIMAPNKTLAAQLCSEYREFFPDNAVEYFVSYYDYYQPEAYIAASDTYIEKDSSINEEIDRLRHRATYSLLTRKDVIVVASVSAIYALGSPEEYSKSFMMVKSGQKVDRIELIKKLVDLHYERNDLELMRGRFRVRGDIIEIIPSYSDELIQLNFFGNEVEEINIREKTSGLRKSSVPDIMIFPATHYILDKQKMDQALLQIESDMNKQVEYFKKNNKLLEANRIEQKTRYDMEMIKEIGYCNGIENYSRYFDGRAEGQHPYTLLDFFPDDYLLVIDESHVGIPQIGGMWAGDKARKEQLIQYGFRLPSALDNRPLNFQEFEKNINQSIFTSATPGDYELDKSDQIVEQLIRPTGLLDPIIEVHPSDGQIDHFIAEARKTIEKGERVLATTLTKRLAEELSDYLKELDFKVTYLHSDINTLERVEILRDLRKGKYDILVGINLLREGLDLPEVSLVVIFDADKEGFLRAERSLIQTTGRAARNVNGRVLMYADKLTKSMAKAINETKRRRKIQGKYNKDHNIKPETIKTRIKDSMGDSLKKIKQLDGIDITAGNMLEIITKLRKDMQKAAEALDFETAVILRDKIIEIEEGV